MERKKMKERHMILALNLKKESKPEQLKTISKETLTINYSSTLKRRAERNS
jgi:hypothetical protein